MPVPGERIKHLKEKFPIFPRVAYPLEGEGLIVLTNTRIAYLSVLFNRELWKKMAINIFRQKIILAEWLIK